MPKAKPVGFISYSHRDDEHEGGRIVQLRERLAGEIRFQLGGDFDIFLDTDIRYGEVWRAAIDGALEAAHFLIPVLTPNFFHRPECRKEVETFLEFERARGRNDLVLPILYIEFERGHSDDLADTLFARQFAKWTHLRFAALTSAEVGKSLEKLALQIKRVLDSMGLHQFDGPSQAAHIDRQAVLTPTTVPPLPGRSPLPMGLTSLPSGPPKLVETIEEDRKVPPPPAINRPRTIAVNANEPSPLRTIGEAIRRATPGDVIQIPPGIYSESLVLDKVLQLIGTGNAADTIIESDGQPVVQFNTIFGVLQNLTIRQRDRGAWPAVDILQGMLFMDRCQISSESLACVLVRPGAEPRLRQNQIVGGRDASVLIDDHAQGIFVDNEIRGHHGPGVLVKGGASPTLRRNRICSGKSYGLLISGEAAGTYEENDIGRNELSGVMVIGDAQPLLRRNRIHSGKAGGIYIDHAGGIFEDNDISGNQGVGVEVTDDGKPVLRRNRIAENHFYGILVRDGARGLIEQNDICDNEMTGIEVKGQGTYPEIRENRVYRAKTMGVYVHQDAEARLEKNQIFENAAAGVEVADGGNVTVLQNSIRDGKVFGVYVRKGGKATIAENVIAGNLWGQIEVAGDRAKLWAEDNQILDGGAEGVVVRDAARAVLKDNQIRGSAKAGVLVDGAAQATLHGNVIRDSGRAPDDRSKLIQRAGVVATGARTKVVLKRGNKITGGSGDGLLVECGASAVVTDSDIGLHPHGAGIHTWRLASVQWQPNRVAGTKEQRLKVQISTASTDKGRSAQAAQGQAAQRQATPPEKPSPRGRIEGNRVQIEKAAKPSKPGAAKGLRNTKNGKPSATSRRN